MKTSHKRLNHHLSREHIGNFVLDEAYRDSANEYLFYVEVGKRQRLLGISKEAAGLVVTAVLKEKIRLAELAFKQPTSYDGESKILD